MDGAENRTGGVAGSDAEPLLVAPAAILEGLPDAVVAMAPDGRIVYVNGLAEELFGYAREELVGRSVEMLSASGCASATCATCSSTSRRRTRCASPPRPGESGATAPSSSAR